MVDDETTCATGAPTKVFVAALFGDVDLLREAELRTLLQDYVNSDSVDVVVDLERVAFMDTTGLTFLVGLRRAAATRGGAVVIDRPSHVCRRVLEIVGFDRIFEIRDAADG